MITEIYVPEDEPAVTKKNKAVVERVAGPPPQPHYLVFDPRKADTPDDALHEWGYDRKYTSDPATFIEELRTALERFRVGRSR